ncbi:MAG: MBL fold metallo-hydrolase [Planctomycetota bacterium]|nr:MBL fold metallo-hydrolase [Planctomycetota bacterium]
MDDVRATLLGTSHAWPLPEPGCGCDQCTASREDAGKRRTRSGFLIQTPAGNALLDAGPDVWQQFEREKLKPEVALVVISHHHDDHVLGLRDLCIMNGRHRRVLPVHCGPVTERLIRATFAGLLREGQERIRFVPWETGSRIELGAVCIEGFETHHRADAPTTAFLVHVPRAEGVVRIAYATDMGSALPEPVERLRGVDLFIGDGTYLGEGNDKHPGTDRMIAIARELRAKRIAVTHVGHWGVDCDTARRLLPPDVAICRDGDDVLSLLA